MAAQEETLESLLTKATNPLNTDEDWDFILAFCDQINKELEGPQIAVRLLAHKIQSPQEREALFSLSALEACVKNCGRRFHQEIGKFRFLNELIKVVSPKYLGNHTTEKVKKKCIELLYSWSQGLPGEGKVGEAYLMLKRQGIVKVDPTYIDKTLEPPPPPRSSNTLFEDDDKSKLLSRLLKSKHPEDLQAANRLIKNMVKQDAERMEKVSKRVQQIETVNNNMKVLSEMLQHYRPGSASDAEKDLMKELYENLEKARPNLFRLASDTDDKDHEGINDILKANDEVLSMMNKYKSVVDGTETGISTTSNSVSSAQSAFSDLLNFEGAFISADSSRNIPCLSSVQQQIVDSHASQHSNVDDDSPGLIDMQGDEDKSQGPSVMSQLNKNDLDILNDIFTTSSQATLASSSGSSDIKLLNLGAPTIPTLPPPRMASQSLGGATSINWDQAGSMMTSPGTTMATGGAVSTTGAQSEQSSSLLGGLTTNCFGGNEQNLMIPNNTGPAVTNATQPFPTDKSDKSGLDALNELGKSLLQQSLSTVPASSLPVITPPAQTLTLNQMASKPVTTGSISLLDQHPLIPSNTQLVASVSPVATPPSSVTASPARVPQKHVEVLPLTDISVPLESVQPGRHPPISAYDKNNIKAVVHVAKDRPRPDVSVMVLSIMSMNTSPIKSLSFQAAVPKIMRVKLQPPSGTELPAYNPILPPTAVTQIMLLANPLQEKIRLKFKLTYTMDNKAVSDVGEVDTFPVQ